MRACITNQDDKLTKLRLETCVTVYNSIGHIRRKRLNLTVLLNVMWIVVVDGGGKKAKKHKISTKKMRWELLTNHYQIWNTTSHTYEHVLCLVTHLRHGSTSTAAATRAAGATPTAPDDASAAARPGHAGAHRRRLSPGRHRRRRSRSRVRVLQQTQARKV